MSLLPALRAVARLLLALMLLLGPTAQALAEQSDVAADIQNIERLEADIADGQASVNRLLGNIKGYENIITLWDLVTRRFTEFKSATMRAVESCEERLTYLEAFEKEHPHLKGDPETVARRKKCNAVLGNYTQTLTIYRQRLSVIELQVADFKALLDRDTGDLGNERLILEKNRAEKTLLESLNGLAKATDQPTDKGFGT